MKNYIKKSLQIALCVVSFGQANPENKKIELTRQQDIPKALNKEQGSGIKTDTLTISKKAEKSPFKGVDLEVVNGYEVAGSSKKGAAIKQEFVTKKEKAEKILQTEQQKLIEANKEFSAKAATMSTAAKETEEKKLAKMERDLKLKAQELKEELEAAMYKQTEELGIEFESIVRTYGREKDLDLIIDESSGRVVYVAENLKCSNEIIRLMDKKFDVKDDKKTLS